MNIESRKLHLIRDLMQVKDERLIDTVINTMRRLRASHLTPHQDSLTEPPAAQIKSKKKKKKKSSALRVFSLEDLHKTGKKGE